MKQTLEKIVSSIKKVGRDSLNSIKKNAKVGMMLGSLVVGGYFVEEAKGNRLKYLVSPVQQGINSSECNIDHHSWFNDDQLYLWGFEPIVDTYIFTDEQALSRDGETAESMDSKVVYISGRGLLEPTETDLNVQIQELLGEQNMLDKKIIGKLYERIDDGDFVYEHVGTYDMWNMHESGQPIQLVVSNGITQGNTFYPSHKFEISFNYNNVADFNNDGEVNFEDFAVLGNEYKQGVGNYLTDISGSVGLSDGVVDEFDLKVFAGNWLAGE